MKVALTIAGSDPTGGAGLQVDLKVFNAYGIYGISVPSVLTAQNTKTVLDIYELPANFFSLQMQGLLQDIIPDATKTGMLYDPEIIRITAQMVRAFDLRHLVIDPVTVSSTGTALIKDKALETLKKELFPLAEVITPNIYEASLLGGIKIEDEEDMKKAAKILKDSGAQTVVITGGHLSDRTIDILYDGVEFLRIEGNKMPGEYHGTGCVYSAALTANLALGQDIKTAALNAKGVVDKAIMSSLRLGNGLSLLNL